ncbi:hypothetical protein D3C81_1886310 [compost metagenome]
MVCPRKVKDKSPRSSNSQPGSAGAKDIASSPSTTENTRLPAIIVRHMLRNSAVEPLSLATKPLPCVPGSGLPPVAMKEEFSSVLRPYTAGSRKGMSEVFSSP